MASCVSVSCLFNQWHRPLFHSNFVSNYVTGCLRSFALSLSFSLISSPVTLDSVGRIRCERASFYLPSNSPINYNKTDLDAWAVEYQWATFRFECIVCVFVMVSIVLPFAQCLRSAHSSRKIRDSAYADLLCHVRFGDAIIHSHTSISLDVCWVRLKCFTMCACACACVSVCAHRCADIVVCIRRVCTLSHICAAFAYLALWVNRFWAHIISYFLGRD